MQFPILKQLSTLRKSYKNCDLSNTVLIAVQHILASNGTLLEELNRLGLHYDRMFVLGKVYSTNNEVAQELTNRGVTVHPASLRTGVISLTKDYRDELDQAAQELLAEALKAFQFMKQDATLLVLDDGGVLVKVVAGQFKAIPSRVVAVEQTRSGSELIRSLQALPFPVVNVAESERKLRDESPYIASSIIEHIQKRIDPLPAAKLSESTVLVVGNGAIGNQVLEKISDQCKEAYGFDSLAQKSTNRSLVELLRSADIIIGCVGKAWLPMDYRKYLKDGVVLASGSSSNIEFLGIELDATDSKSPHRAYSFATDQGTGWVLNAGFPVNFDGSPDPIKPPTIELTRLLMLSGALQVISTNLKPGLHKLDLKI